MYNKIKNYIINHYTTDEDKVILNVISDQALQIENFESMKATDGWKVLNKSLRDDLKARLLEGVKEDARAQTLLDILATVETKERSVLLEEEINSILPQ